MQVLNFGVFYNRQTYLILALILLGLSAGFGYLHYRQKAVERAYQEYIQEKQKEMQARKLEKDRLDRIEQERLAKVREAQRLAEEEKRRKAEEEAQRLADIEMLNKFARELAEQQKLLTISGDEEGTRQVKLSVDEYSELTIKVARGMRLEMPNGHFKEFFKIGYFQKNYLVNEMLVGNDNSHWSTRPSVLFYFFWDAYDLKLKAAEVPHTMDFRFKLNKVKLRLNRIIIGDAYFLEQGEVVITPIYLDEKDRFEVDGFTFESSAFNAKRDFLASYNMRESVYAFRNDKGYLQINAKKRIIIDDIKLERVTYYSYLKLSPDKEFPFKVYKDDVIWTESASRYFVNNENMEKNRGNVHEIVNDGILLIKGSYGNDSIQLKVLKRKGY